MRIIFFKKLEFSWTFPEHFNIIQEHEPRAKIFLQNNPYEWTEYCHIKDHIRIVDEVNDKKKGV